MSKIDEEHDELCSMSERKKPSRISNLQELKHHTVSGHEAMNLAKRLSEELATQNQTGSESAALNLPRAMSPDCEPISRSYEGKKGELIISESVAHFVEVFSFVVQWDELMRLIGSSLNYRCNKFRKFRDPNFICSERRPIAVS